MKSRNRVFLEGNLTFDPSLKYTQANVPVCNFSIATNESWKDKATGEWVKETEYHDIEAWTGAEFIKENATKGCWVSLEGRIKSRKYTNKDGVEVKAYTIKADWVNVFPKQRDQIAEIREAEKNLPPVKDDDLPF
jgi:single-strand DNA-binding protein